MPQFPDAVVCSTCPIAVLKLRSAIRQLDVGNQDTFASIQGNDRGARAKQTLFCWPNNSFQTGWGLPLAWYGMAKI